MRSSNIRGCRTRRGSATRRRSSRPSISGSRAHRLRGARRRRGRHQPEICPDCHRASTRTRPPGSCPGTRRRRLSAERRADELPVGRSRSNANFPGGGGAVLRRLILIAALSLPAIAAEEKPGVKVVQEPDKVVVRKRTVIDFNDVTVEGELTRPEGSYVLNRNRTRFPSLIRLRDNFNPELQKSADNL